MLLAGTVKGPREPATTSRAPAADASRKRATRTKPTVASRRAQRPLRHAVNVISSHGVTGALVLRASRAIHLIARRNPPSTAADKAMIAGRPHHHCADASVEYTKPAPSRANDAAATR